MDAKTMIARAEAFADDVLFPASLAVDRADRVPAGHFEKLAAQGFYGIAAPVEAGGLGTGDMSLAMSTVEALASGCLATAFVWIQHHGPVLAAAFSQEPGVREKWLQPLASGQLRGGIARAGARPGGLTVEAVAGGYYLDGVVPWVTGWDLIDVVHVAALDDDVIRFLLVDAVVSETLTAQPHELVAANASRTVTLTFHHHWVPAERFTGAQPYVDWQRSEAPGSALNGALALGVATRCRKLLGGTSFDEEIAACRESLVAADATTTPAARATASELAMRCATTLMVHTGSRSVLTDSAAQMLLREAGFLLVFGTRPLIREALLARVKRASLQ